MYSALSIITGPRFLSALLIIMLGLFYSSNSAAVSSGCCLFMFDGFMCVMRDSKAFLECVRYCSRNCPAFGGSQSVV